MGATSGSDKKTKCDKTCHINCIKNEAGVHICPPDTSKRQYKIMYQEYLKNQSGGTDNHLDKWTNQQKNGPVAYYPTIVKKYGKPAIESNVPGGICVWYIKGKDNDPHEELWLRDEYIKHSKPKDHVDFFYSYVKIFISKEKLWEVLALSSSINYDPLKKLLFARCGSFEANYATIRTVLETLNNTDTDYAKNINNKEEESMSNEEYVKREVAKNKTTYSKILTEPFYVFLKK